MWNVSYVGEIFYYGKKVLFVYNKLNQHILQIEVERPIYLISTDKYPKPDTYSNFSISIPCEEITLNINYSLLWTSIHYPTALIVPID